MTRFECAVVQISGVVKQLICINWGRKYGPRYINRLYGGISRNITPPFTLTCFCDTPEGIRSEVRTEPLPPLDVAMPKGTKGIWPKARLWNAELADLSGPVLFMDLDLVVVGNLDGFFTEGSAEDVILARNENTPFEKLGQTSIFRFPVGKLLPLLERFRSDPQGIADTYEFEQRFVTRNAPGGIKFWPSGWVRHFRRDCTQPFPLNYFRSPACPKDAKVVIFPGGTLPPHVIAGQYNKYYTTGGPMSHLKGLFAKDRRDPPFRYIRRYIRRTDWVEEAWRE
ncbi:MAG: glycosyl transferase [Pseudomonadota bacterium]